MLCALIMAGGKGTRFWPKSTEDKPKQFLNLISDSSMLKITYDRINKIIDKNHIFICTSENYVDLVKSQISDISLKNIILEPCSKNTAPCILLSTLYINKIFPGSNIITLPSDHIINNESQFYSDISIADQYINSTNNQAIVTLGIKPDRIETDYGYIKFINKGNQIEKVDKFVEKPCYELAKQYYESKNFLWNAGIFIFNAVCMLNEFKTHLTDEYDLLSALPDIDDLSYHDELVDKYNKCNKISIDYAIIEKSNNVYTIPTNIGWDDIGTWKSLERYIQKDSNGNTLKGNITVQNSNNNIVYADGKKIILLNVDDIFVIDSDDVIIVGKREHIQDVSSLK